MPRPGSTSPIWSSSIPSAPAGPLRRDRRRRPQEVLLGRWRRRFDCGDDPTLAGEARPIAVAEIHLPAKVAGGIRGPEASPTNMQVEDTASGSFTDPDLAGARLPRTITAPASCNIACLPTFAAIARGAKNSAFCCGRAPILPMSKNMRAADFLLDLTRRGEADVEASNRIADRLWRSPASTRRSVAGSRDVSKSAISPLVGPQRRQGDRAISDGIGDRLRSVQ